MFNSSIEIGLNVNPVIYLHVGNTEYRFGIDEVEFYDNNDDGSCIIKTRNNVEYNVRETKDDIEDAIETARYYKQQAISYVKSLLEN